MQTSERCKSCIDDHDNWTICTAHYIQTKYPVKVQKRNSCIKRKPRDATALVPQQPKSVNAGPPDEEKNRFTEVNGTAFELASTILTIASVYAVGHIRRQLFILAGLSITVARCAN